MKNEKNGLDKKVGQLENDVQQLMSRMNDIQSAMDRNFEDFNDKFEI